MAGTSVLGDPGPPGLISSFPVASAVEPVEDCRCQLDVKAASDPVAWGRWLCSHSMKRTQCQSDGHSDLLLDGHLRSPFIRAGSMPGLNSIPNVIRRNECRPESTHHN